METPIIIDGSKEDGGVFTGIRDLVKYGSFDGSLEFPITKELNVGGDLVPAANSNVQPLQFGLKAGPNFSNFSGNDAGGLKTRTSFHIGAMAEIGLARSLSLQPELLYS